MDRQFNVLIKAVGGDGEKGTVHNTTFGVHFHTQKFIKPPIKKKLHNFHLLCIS